MSVTREADGRRSVEVEFHVPGTPEEVWQALATGPGISSWFVPTEVEEHDGKAVAVNYHFGPGMEIRSVVTASDQPRRFVQEGDGMTPCSPPMATEWTIAARDGGSCIVRVVHSMFASTDEWDDQLESAKGGWAGFLSILRLYLTHFRGQHSAIMQVSMPVATTEAATWETLTTALGVKGLLVGQRWTTPAGVSPLGGVVELLTEDPWDALLRLDTPGPGIAALGAVTYPGGQGMVAMNLYLYGDQADAAVARETPLWQAWFEQRFAAPPESP
ncbi:MAG: SRPBCC domain-containing protein [Gemmatimonadales bacterium]|nr:SRPBCC domain-containing protein [Gemmatimonadales bacterium]